MKTFTKISKRLSELGYPQHNKKTLHKPKAEEMIKYMIQGGAEVVIKYDDGLYWCHAKRPPVNHKGYHLGKRHGSLECVIGRVLIRLMEGSFLSHNK